MASDFSACLDICSLSLLEVRFTDALCVGEMVNQKALSIFSIARFCRWGRGGYMVTASWAGVYANVVVYSRGSSGKLNG